MTKRIVEVARNPSRVTTAHGQVVIRCDTEGELRELRVPAEDLGILILDHPQCSVSQPALARIAGSGGVVVVCGSKHLPAGILLPVSSNTETVHRIHDQINVPLPLTKQLWKQIIKAKITAQAMNLPAGSAPHRNLRKLATRVRSGDGGNLEAQAARVYWQSLFGTAVKFKRDQDGDGINALLNYGYAIVRAAMARALVGTGFCCAIGLHHHHRANPFCLADDLLEPLRPLVDARVLAILDEGGASITPETKQPLCQLLLDPVRLDGLRMPLMDAVQRTSASLAACLRKEQKRLLLPEREDA